MPADSERPLVPSHAERLAGAACRLAAVTETPRLDAEILLAHALAIPRASLFARLRERVEVPAFDDLIERRLAYEPIAYILGEWEFFSLMFTVSPPLLVPRPETEHLVEAVLEFVKDRPARVLDIGAGTGCVAIAIARNASQCRVVATDINPFALETAAANAERHGVSDRITFRTGDLFSALREGDAPFDVIASNPPYVEEDAWPQLPPAIRLHEDPGALLAGKDGLDVVGRIARDAPDFLKPEGLLALEIGMGQSESVEGLLTELGYRAIAFKSDLAGTPRIAHACPPSPPKSS